MEGPARPSSAAGGMPKKERRKRGTHLPPECTFNTRLETAAAEAETEAV